MEKTRITTTLYSQFLLASEGNITATRAEEVLLEPGIHDRITRWLATSQLTPGMLFDQVKSLVNLSGGWFILDDSVLDKPFGPEIDLSCWQYSGRQHKPVRGIGLLTLIWTNGIIAVPVNYRVYDKKTDGKSKHKHARELLTWAKGHGFTPEDVLMDAWYTASQTLRLIARFGWTWIAEIRSNRVCYTPSGARQHLKDLSLRENGGTVYLKEVGYVRVAKSVTQQNGCVRYLGSNNLQLADVSLAYARRWEIEVYHREIKQVTRVANCQARRSRSQRNHIFCALLAYTSLQFHRFTTGLTSYQTKLKILAPAIRDYLATPTVVMF
ncbi:transposase [Patescibacteria group bacterium]|nr:transposase [Patescibacteria group bacterium]